MGLKRYLKKPVDQVYAPGTPAYKEMITNIKYAIQQQGRFYMTIKTYNSMMSRNIYDTFTADLANEGYKAMPPRVFQKDLIVIYEKRAWEKLQEVIAAQAQKRRESTRERSQEIYDRFVGLANLGAEQPELWIDGNEIGPLQRGELMLATGFIFFEDRIEIVRIANDYEVLGEPMATPMRIDGNEFIVTSIKEVGEVEQEVDTITFIDIVTTPVTRGGQAGEVYTLLLSDLNGSTSSLVRVSDIKPAEAK